MDTNWLTTNYKKVVSFVVFIILYLLFQNLIESLLIDLGSLITTDTVGFKFAYVLLFLLLSIYYVHKIEEKYIPNPNFTFGILLILFYYVVFRISNNDSKLEPYFYNLKYLDILWYASLLHLILWYTSKKTKFKHEPDFSNFFIEEKPHNGEIDNQLVLDKLVEVVSNLKTENSFTIGLNAPWGYGKSTFLYQFYNRYSKENGDSIIFWYSIWKNKGSSAIIDNFFQLLASELKPFSGEIGNEIDGYVNEILQIAPGEIGGVLQAGKRLLIEEKSTEEYYERIDTIIKKIDRQIIVVLDDLDRLETEEILDSFKLIRTLSDFNNIIFIAGYNRDYIEKMCGPSKKDYINKIFQVEINLLPFDEKRIREVILDEVRKSFPTTTNDSLNLKLFQGFYGLFDNTYDYTPKLVDLFIGENDTPREILSLNWYRFLKTYRDINRFSNEFKFNYTFINEQDIVPKEYILLKLLFFKYRELQQTIFLNLEDVLSNYIVDTENNKLQFTNIGYGGVYVYDDPAYSRLSDKLRSYKKEDIQLIDAVFLKLFGKKDIKYYADNQNSITQVYHTNTYVRNNIAGAVYKLSDFTKAYEDLKLEELIDEIENYSSQTKFQVLNELKRFLLNQEIKTKDQFVNYFSGINRFFGQNSINENQRIINKMTKSLEDFFPKAKKQFIEDIKGIINFPKIGYLDRLLQDININQKRLKRPDLYGPNNTIDYKNVVFKDEEIKEILISKLKYAIKKTSQTKLIIEAYHLYTDFIATDHQIIRPAIANDIIQKDIKERFVYYFRAHFFDFHETSGGTAPSSYRQYAPNNFLRQIFSLSSTVLKLKKNSKDNILFQRFEREGWLFYYKYLCGITKLTIYDDEFTLVRLEKLKKLLRLFIEKGYQPLNQGEYTKIWNS